MLGSERGARGGKGPPTRSPGPLVPGVPCGGLRDTARRAAASANSRAPAPGPSGADRSATVPREALRFHSRGQRRWEPAKTCFPAVMNFITLFLFTRKAVSFEQFFFPPREKGSLAAFLQGGGGELGQSAACSEDARARGRDLNAADPGALPGLGWAAPCLPWIRTCRARAGGVGSSFCAASSQAPSAGREAHGPIAARDLGWVHSGLWGGAFIFWGDGWLGHALRSRETQGSQDEDQCPVPAHSGAHTFPSTSQSVPELKSAPITAFPLTFHSLGSHSLPSRRTPTTHCSWLLPAPGKGKSSTPHPGHQSPKAQTNSVSISGHLERVLPAHGPDLSVPLSLGNPMMRPPIYLGAGKSNSAFGEVH